MMICFKLIILIFLVSLQGLNAAEKLPSLIKNLNNNLDQVGILNSIDNCGNCSGDFTANTNTNEIGILESAVNKKTIEISVITIDKANSLVKEFLEMKDIPFDYALDGCFARALKIAQLMDQQKIISGKAFIQGRLFASTKYGPVSWRYHVAPVIYVRENGVLTLYIIDPSLSSKAIKYEDWKNLIANGGKPQNPKIPPRILQFFTNRFVYDPTGINSDLTQYNQADLNDMDSTLARLLDIKKQLDLKEL